MIENQTLAIQAGIAPAPRRRQVMRACTDASIAEMDRALEALAPLPDIEDVRPAETGLVMLRGRIGGDGAAFNVGEATVTRAVVRLASGETGFSYLLGRSLERARRAAILDALGQDEARHAILLSAFIEPVAARVAVERSNARQQTAATRVNFFTLVRGED